MTPYLDDVIIYSSSFNEHLNRLSTVLCRLQQAGLTLKPSKCFFCRPSVPYLGYIASASGLQPNTEKIAAVQAFPQPTTTTQLKGFLGLASYYRRFIHHFSAIAAPLNRLLERGQPWLWTPACNTAFNTLKDRLTTAPILAFPLFD